MKSKAYGLLLLVALACCLAGWTAYAQKENPTQTGKVVWEYKTIQGNRALREDQLNDMGSYGWELVTFDDGERGNGSYGGTFYFKRLKQ